jgi:membrane fusion protein, multidrug efflux system
MNAPKLWIAGLSAAVLAVSGSYLWLEGMPTSVMKPAANNPAARPVPVTTAVVKDQEFAILTVIRACSAFFSVSFFLPSQA